jgi:hypothetical protein
MKTPAWWSWSGFFVWFVWPYAFLIRAIGLPAAALWYDESFSWHSSRLPVAQTIQLSRLDFTPPLWEILLHWVPSSPLWLIRLPALLFGMLSLLAAWQLMKALYFPRTLRLVSLAVMAVLPGLIWTAQDARVYAFLSFLYVAGALFSVRRTWWALLTVNLLLFYTHATAPVYVVSLAVFALRYHRDDWKAILMASAVPGLLYLPWLLVLSHNVHAYGQAALSIPQFLYALVMAGFVNAFTNEWAALCVSLLIVLTFGISLFRRTLGTVGEMVIIPLVGMVLASLLLANVIIYRTLIPLLIPFVIFTMATFGEMNFKKAYFAGAWIAVLLVCFLTFNPADRGGYLDRAAQDIAAQWQPGDVLYLGAGTALPVADYLPGKPFFIMDAEQTALLGPDGGRLMGLHYAPLENIPHTRAWIIFPDDMQLTPTDRARLTAYTHGARLVTTIHYWQTAPLSVYLQEGK